MYLSSAHMSSEIKYVCDTHLALKCQTSSFESVSGIAEVTAFRT
jgi:hypothetical protein